MTTYISVFDPMIPGGPTAFNFLDDLISFKCATCAQRFIGKRNWIDHIEECMDKYFEVAKRINDKRTNKHD